jgi:pantothenate kinase
VYYVGDICRTSTGIRIHIFILKVKPQIDNKPFFKCVPSRPIQTVVEFLNSEGQHKKRLCLVMCTVSYVNKQIEM